MKMKRTLLVLALMMCAQDASAGWWGDMTGWFVSKLPESWQGRACAAGVATACAVGGTYLYRQRQQRLAAEAAEAAKKAVEDLKKHCGVAWRQGRRKTMEDSHVVEEINGSLVVGIFDGHGETGLIVANEAVEIAKNSGTSNPSAILVAVEKGLNEWTAYESGAVAIVARIEDNKLDVSWVGDSRILVFDKNTKNKIFESQDHNWINEKEFARVDKRRADIVEGTVEGRKVRRVNGLMPSRVLGDFKQKYDPIWSDPEAAPQIPLKKDYVIIMACDGLWDVFTAEQLIEYYSNLKPLATHPVLPEKEIKGSGSEGALAEVGIAIQLRDAAYERKSGDNISVIVITVQ